MPFAAYTNKLVPECRIPDRGFQLAWAKPGSCAVESPPALNTSGSAGAFTAVGADAIAFGGRRPNAMQTLTRGG